MDKSFIFSDVIHTYTTKEAINDCNLIKVITSTSEEAGINYPVLLTRAVWERYIEVSKDFDSFQDEDGRLWDILYMFRYEAKKCSDNALEFIFICQFLILKSCCQTRNISLLNPICARLLFLHRSELRTLMIP